PQVTLVRGRLKLVRSLGEPDLAYDLDDDAGERAPLRPEQALAELAHAADARWDLERLDAAVRDSQERRRLVARALSLGRVTAWDHPTLDPRGPYIRTGDDFWQTLEAARRA